MENNKVKAVKEWKTPAKIKEIESFLGFANFYWRFIKKLKSYSKTSQQAQKKKEIEMGNGTLRSIWRIKRMIASQPVLALPKKEGKFQIETDASEYAIGGVLSQE